MNEGRKPDEVPSSRGGREVGGSADGHLPNRNGATEGQHGRNQGEAAGPEVKGREREELTPKASLPLYGPKDWQREYDDGSSVEEWRTGAYRDYARVIHSPGWRRLQGKTQLFPGHESDFFRNRLTHSLEVAQVAEAIAMRLNYEHSFFKANPLDSRLCATAGLMHDLGHPPFGHNGEHALDDMMHEFGGFEGNAQTLRIIARLEKKVQRSDLRGSADGRCGLNLSYRTIAAALKYDREIPHVRDEGDGLVKGYYADDADVVARVKAAVAPAYTAERGNFKTIECSIMDLADDIAYSTYDLEDSLKAGFLTPASILSSDEGLLDRVAVKVSKSTGVNVDRAGVLDVLVSIFDVVLESDPRSTPPELIVRAFRASQNLADSGYLRTALTAQLVGEMVNSVEVELNAECPPLSRAKLSPEALLKVETLKNYTFEATIYSSRLRVAEFRGYEVVTSIFAALSGAKGHLMMPDDVRELYGRFEANATARMRVICDFIAGMTDRYAVEFYGRLHSDSGQTIFKPL